MALQPGLVQLAAQGHDERHYSVRRRAPSDPTVGIAGCCARSERSCGRRDAADKRDDLATSHVTTPEDRALRNMKNDIILMKNDITLRRGCVRNGFAL
jgi:hypothetical protein